MNWNCFSLIGYLSVLLWVAVPLLWLARRKRRSMRWACPAALLLALLSFAFAKINSERHVNRIELDRSAQMADQQAHEEAKRKAAEDGRGGEVAQIRFAEDASGDFLDKAGMDEADRKYMESLDQPSEPEWKNSKKQRGGEAAQDDDLESMLGGKQAVEGMQSDAIQDTEEKPSAVMSEAGLAMAHRLDGLNLNVIRVLILIAVLMLALDYLGRTNVYADAVFPLPLPSAWSNAVTPIPPLVIRPASPRRCIQEELAWLAKRGDSFVYLTNNPAASEFPPSLPRFGKNGRPVDVLQVAGEEVSDDFIFESLWYGRACFTVGSADRAGRMLARFLELMEKRKKARARVAQTAHVVWNMKSPMPEALMSTFTRLAAATGFSLFVCDDAARPFGADDM